MQDDGKTWVYDGTTGTLISPETSSYIWLSHLCQGRGIATNSDAVYIPHPLQKDGLLPLIEANTVTTKHNAPAVLMILDVCVLLSILRLSLRPLESVQLLLFVETLALENFLHCEWFSPRLDVRREFQGHTRKVHPQVYIPIWNR